MTRARPQSDAKALAALLVRRGLAVHTPAKRFVISVTNAGRCADIGQGPVQSFGGVKS